MSIIVVSIQSNWQKMFVIDGLGYKKKKIYSKESLWDQLLMLKSLNICF